MNPAPALLVIGLGAAIPGPVGAQAIVPPSLDSVAALRLDSIVGAAATAYFRPADRARALQVHGLLEDFLGYHRTEAAIDTRLRVAVVGPEDWERITRLPFGLPTNSGLLGNLLLAATVPPERVGARSLPGGAITDLLVVGHEGGHLLTYALMPDALKANLTIRPDSWPPDVARRFARIQRVKPWYWELAANWFAEAFIAAKRPAAATGWRDYLEANAAIPPPRFTHLDDWLSFAANQPVAADSTPWVLTEEGGLNQSWYQGAVGLAAAHLYEHAGFGMLAHVRRMIGGEGPTTTPGIVAELEALAPGFSALLDRLGVDWRARAEEEPGTANPH